MNARPTFTRSPKCPWEILPWSLALRAGPGPPVHAMLGTAVGTATIVDDDGPYVALNLGLSGVYLADIPSGPGAEG